MKKTRLLALLLMLVTVICTVAGCDSGNVTNNSGNDANLPDANATDGNNAGDDKPADDPVEVNYFESEHIYDLVDNKTSEVSAAELSMADEWFEKNILCVKDGKAPAFSFMYDGKALANSMGDYTVKVDEQAEENGKKPYIITLTHKTDGFTVTCEAVKYTEYPTFEWTVYIENTGKSGTKEFSDILALDGLYDIGETSYENVTMRLHYNNGSPDTPDAFLPLDKGLRGGQTFNVGARTGRASYSVMPFFNLNLNRYGVVFAVGWPGQWAGSFTNVDDKQANVKFGQENISGALNAGEKIRTPLVAVQFYTNSVIKGNNIFRRWVIEYNSDNNQRQQINSGSIEHNLMQNATTENELAVLEKMNAMGLQNEGFWMDAGWYQMIGDKGWVFTGNWVPDPVRWPDAMKDLNAAIKSSGRVQVLWFEPERVMPGTELYKKSEWLLKAGANLNGSNYGDDWRLWDFSNDDATKYMCELIDTQIKAIGVGVYRQDFNTDPLNFWTNKDKLNGDGRKGFTENKYVVNFLKYWDYLLEKNPGLLIDNCASGGRRICLETVRRSVVFWRNDLCYEPIAQQNHTTGLAYWLPYTGTGSLMLKDMSASYIGDDGGIYTTIYTFRSCWSGELNLGFNYSTYDENNTTYFENYLKQVDKYLSIRKYYLKDYYPLINVDKDDPTSTSAYIAAQYHDAPENSGMITLIRRQRAAKQKVQIKLYGLDPDVTYIVTNIDGGTQFEATGYELMTDGTVLKTPGKASYMILTYAPKA